MKKLGKIIISPDKMMKNEELINLQGGYTGGGGNLTLICKDPETGWTCNFAVSDCAQYIIHYICASSGCPPPYSCG